MLCSIVHSWKSQKKQAWHETHLENENVVI